MTVCCMLMLKQYLAGPPLGDEEQAGQGQAQVGHPLAEGRSPCPPVPGALVRLHSHMLLASDSCGCGCTLICSDLQPAAVAKLVYKCSMPGVLDL